MLGKDVDVRLGAILGPLRVLLRRLKDLLGHDLVQFERLAQVAPLVLLELLLG